MAQISKSEKLARLRLIYHLWMGSEDRIPMREVREQVPDTWHLIEVDARLSCAQVEGDAVS